MVMMMMMTAVAGVNVKHDRRMRHIIISSRRHNQNKTLFCYSVKVFLSVFISVYFQGQLSEQGFLPGCPVWHICITFMLTNKSDLI